MTAPGVFWELAKEILILYFTKPGIQISLVGSMINIPNAASIAHTCKNDSEPADLYRSYQ